MSRYLTFSNHLISLFGGMTISDEHERECYVAKGQFSLISKRWKLFRADSANTELVTIRKKKLAIRPTYIVTGATGEMWFRRKLLSFKRQFWVEQGAWAGAWVRGANILDLSFTVEHQGKTLAAASEKLFSLRDKHVIQVHADDEQTELFVVICMLILQLDKRHQDD